jgi:hypothetical protein
MSAVTTIRSPLKPSSRYNLAHQPGATRIEETQSFHTSVVVVPPEASDEDSTHGTLEVFQVLDVLRNVRRRAEIVRVFVDDDPGCEL